jgi:hypothetical protein
MRLTPNIRKNLPYLFGINALEDNTEQPNQFLKKYLEARQVWASKNIKKEPENVQKSDLLQS